MTSSKYLGLFILGVDYAARGASSGAVPWEANELICYENEDLFPLMPSALSPAQLQHPADGNFGTGAEIFRNDDLG